MTNIETEDFFAFVKTQERVVHKTFKRKKDFFVKVVNLKGKRRLDFIVVSSGKVRKHNADYVQRVLETFNETNSFDSKDYGFTVNATYQLPLIDLYLKQRTVGAIDRDGKGSVVLGMFNFAIETMNNDQLNTLRSHLLTAFPKGEEQTAVLEVLDGRRAILKLSGRQ